MQNLKKVFFKTFGCRTNMFDTQVMINNLKEYQRVDSEDDADIIIINSCTVTNGADTGLRTYVNRYSDKEIFLTGCAVETEGKKLYERDAVHSVFGHSEREKIDAILKNDFRFFDVGDKNYIDDSIVTEFVGKSRAFVKIQEGCNFECSYCIIPTARGIARSKSEATILKQIEILGDLGFSEVILTGTNVGSYGRDTDTTIAKLTKKIMQNPNIKRVRIGSLEPSQIDDEFLELLNEEKMEQHLHIALQHTSDAMLEIMKRRNRVASDLELFEKIASKNVAIGTDFIVGHPGESEAIWSEAYENLKRFPLTHIHLFSYSKRDGTESASRKDIVKGDIAKERLKIAKELVDSKNLEFRKSKMPLKVLVEGSTKVVDSHKVYSGFDQYYNKIEIESGKELEKSWVDIREYSVESEKNVAKI